MNRAATTNPTEAIALAAKAFASADRNLRLAAEYLAFAEEKGATQRQMAEGVGKSAAWVNGLLKWRRDGYQDNTPFAAQSAERDERHDEQIREQERSGPKQASHGREHSGPKSERSSQNKARERTRRKQHICGLSEQDRNTLVKILGMLGSSHDNEALNAARSAETLRAKLNLTWNDLIATPAEVRRAA
jgi:hypothetical protein